MNLLGLNTCADCMFWNEKTGKCGNQKSKYYNRGLSYFKLACEVFTFNELTEKKKE